MAARHLRSGLPLLRAHFAATESAAVAQGSRGFASQVAKPAAKQIKVSEAPYDVTDYASALFRLAAKTNVYKVEPEIRDVVFNKVESEIRDVVLDKVESEIRDVVEASKKCPAFSQFINDYLSVPKETRVKAITEIFAEAGFSDVMKNFLAALVDNGRLKHIEPITERFGDLAMAHEEVKVIVEADYPLCKQEERELEKYWQEYWQDILGKSVTISIEQKIDYSTLGVPEWED